MFSLAVLSLLASLSTEDFTQQQLSLLQVALNAEQLSQRLTDGYLSCQQSASAKHWENLKQELESYPAVSRIEQTLALPIDSYRDFVHSIALQPSRNAVKWHKQELSCDDEDAREQLFRDYREAYFSLELSSPLEQSFTDTFELKQQSNDLQQQSHQKLIVNSNSIAIASVVHKSQLSAIEQANYLHLDYRSDYIFRTQRGWKHYPPLFLGMHRYLSAAELADDSQQWLIFLDHQQHFISAIPLTEARSYLELLGAEHWSFDRHGNLKRNP